MARTPINTAEILRVPILIDMTLLSFCFEPKLNLYAIRAIRTKNKVMDEIEKILDSRPDKQ